MQTSNIARSRLRPVRRWLLGGAAIIALIPAAAAFGDAPGEARLLESIKYLASDDLEGRGVSTQGINKAAEYIRAGFEKAGLDTTRVDGGAFQSFSMVTGSELGSPNVLSLVDSHGKATALEYDKQFRTCSFGGSGEFEGELVFCGYGIEAADENYDDFAAVDLKGKVALIMRRAPQQANPHGPFANPHGGISRHADLRTKVSNAFRKGAVAVLLVNDPYSARKSAETDQKLVSKATDDVVAAAELFEAAASDDQQQLAAARKKLAVAVKKLKGARNDAASTQGDALMEFGHAGGSKDSAVPVMHITRASADEVLKAALGKSLDELEAAIDEDVKPRSAALSGWRARGVTTVQTLRADVKNVIGVLEGVGPLADETIVIGAHYDHLGYGGDGSLSPGVKEIHNGADDNASGATALVELARRLGGRTEKLPRRLVFIAFTGEELGLIGSANYVKTPVFPLEKTIAMFNMDMVGRLTDDKLTVFGTGTAPRWKGLVERTGTQQGFKLSLKDDGFGPSDQTSFYAKRIPVLHFFTGTHSDYHRPSDDWEKINVHGMAQVLAMVEQIVVETAQTPERPEYVEVARAAPEGRGDSRPYFGSVPDFGTEGEGYAISSVTPGGPAAEGGLAGGDSIVQLGADKIGGLDDFDLALRKHAPGDEVKVVVLRGGKRVELKVTLAKPR